MYSDFFWFSFNKELLFLCLNHSPLFACMFFSKWFNDNCLDLVTWFIYYRIHTQCVYIFCFLVFLCLKHFLSEYVCSAFLQMNERTLLVNGIMNPRSFRTIMFVNLKNGLLPKAQRDHFSPKKVFSLSINLGNLCIKELR